MTDEKIKTYKGFDKNLQCRGFQYEVGQTYTTDVAVACESGFHACEYPLDVFSYYPPADSRFCHVEQAGEISKHGADTKVASTKITIGAELDIAGLVKAAIYYTTERCLPIDKESPASSTGTRGAASSTGDYGAASSTGYYGAASSTGDYGAASSTGTRGAASSTGKRSVAMSAGRFGKASGSDGCALFLVYRNDDGEIVHAKAAIVGRDGIKPDTFYSLDEHGEFVEEAC
jgi:hypothetical protein